MLFVQQVPVTLAIHSILYNIFLGPIVEYQQYFSMFSSIESKLNETEQYNYVHMVPNQNYFTLLPN